MARTAIDEGAVRCRRCSAVTRRDLARCLRCGTAIASPQPAASADSLRQRAGVIAAVAGCLALCGYAISGRASDVPRQALTSPLQPRPSAAQPVHNSGSGTVTYAPAPRVTAFESSRSATLAYNSGNVASAVDGFTAAVEAEPANALALNNLGQVLVRSGRPREAIPYFDRAVAASEQTWTYHFNRARAYAELKEWGAAIEGYRQAATLFPDDYVTAFNLAKALQADGNLAGALPEFERAIRLAPGEADFLLAYAAALEAAGRPQDALAAYRHYLELDPAAAQADKVKGRIGQLSAS